MSAVVVAGMLGARASAWAEAWGVPDLGELPEPRKHWRRLLPPDARVLVVQRPDRLESYVLGGADLAPVWVDLLGGRIGHRRREGGGAGDLLVKAVGVGRGPPPRVIDVTASLGSDAFLLADAGCDVVGIERHPVVHALAEDGLRRAEADPTAAAAVARTTRRLGDAVLLLPGLVGEGDVVYLDPMYPDTTKQTALPSKALQWLRVLVGEDDSGADLLAAAQASGARRVVVKRPLRAPPLGAGVRHRVEGSTTRMDVYLWP